MQSSFEVAPLINAPAAATNGLKNKNDYWPETVIINGEKVGETTTHYELISDFVKMLKAFLHNRADVLVAANLNVYYDTDNQQKFYAPDILISFGVGNQARTSYKIWEEPHFPQIVFEVASKATAKTDLGEKYFDYDEWNVAEYYLIDAERRHLPAPLIAYQRRDNRLTAVPIENGRVLSALLNLEIVDDSSNFRLFNPTTNGFLKTPLELEYERARIAEEKAEIAAENAALRQRLARYENGEG